MAENSRTSRCTHLGQKHRGGDLEVGPLRGVVACPHRAEALRTGEVGSGENERSLLRSERRSRRRESVALLPPAHRRPVVEETVEVVPLAVLDAFEMRRRANKRSGRRSSRRGTINDALMTRRRPGRSASRNWNSKEP